MKPMTAEEWQTEFFLALTAANATEREIAGATADVESFCADSGQTPTEAFGDPREYAKQLGLGRSTTWRERLGYLIHVPTMLGIFVVFDGAHHLAAGTTSSLTWGHLTAAGLLTLTAVGFATAFFQGRGVVAWLIGAVGLTGSVLAAVTLDRVVVDYPPTLALVLGGLLLVVPATVGTVQSVRERAAALAAATSEGGPGNVSDDDRLGLKVIIASHWGVVVAAFVFAWVIALVVRLVAPAG